MRQPVCDGEDGLVRKVVAARDDEGVMAARHRRRGRKASVQDDAAPRKVLPGTGDGATSDLLADGTRQETDRPPCVSHGAVSVIGRRREMEDAVAVAPTFLASPAADADEKFFAVYDGHGGSRVAEACRDRMHVVLAEELRRRPGADARGWKDALAASFARVDCEVVGSAAAGADADVDEARSRTVGSTAVVAVVGRRRIVVANCGDSRAVLSRGGVAVPLSTDHKPDRPDELQRVEAAGGRVINWNGSRVLGVLSTSRSIGDYYLKPYVSAEPEVTAVERPDELQRVEAAGGRVINWNGSRVLGVLSTSRSIGDYYLKPYVSAEPEVTAVERTEKDEFLVLASDGLWDVVSNELSCRVARSCLNGHLAAAFPESVAGRTCSDAAALLAELAMSRGSKDNISVVVVELRRLKSGAGRRRAAASEVKM